MSYDKVRQYYSVFDEWSRLSSPEGMLEFTLLHRIIDKTIKIGSKVLDLGGGPGRHTIELAKKGYTMTLGDLSPDLVKTAKEKAKGVPNIESIDVVNSVDMKIYKDASFDAVLCFGPLYHIIDDADIDRTLSEVYRVLKPGGEILAIYIPYLTGVSGIIERSMYDPAQVDAAVLDEVYRKGIFHNKTDSGFQEGRFLKASEVNTIMSKAGFLKTQIRSVRGFGYKLEKGIIQKESEDKEMYNKIIQIIEESAALSELADTNGHALYIGKKPE